jgi:hypothetical protein
MQKEPTKLVAITAVDEKSRKTVVVGEAVVSIDVNGTMVVAGKIYAPHRHLVARNVESLAGLSVTPIFVGGRKHHD